jgi:hypothetical protein
MGDRQPKITFVTLGPEGTCHERAVRRYAEFQGIEDFEHAEELRLDLDIGEIDTTWVVYGTNKRFEGDVIGIPSTEQLLRRGTYASQR